jgi:hypothetical protein
VLLKVLGNVWRQATEATANFQRPTRFNALFGYESQATPQVHYLIVVPAQETSRIFGLNETFRSEGDKFSQSNHAAGRSNKPPNCPL